MCIHRGDEKHEREIIHFHSFLIREGTDRSFEMNYASFHWRCVTDSSGDSSGPVGFGRQFSHSSREGKPNEEISNEKAVKKLSQLRPCGDLREECRDNSRGIRECPQNMK